MALRWVPLVALSDPDPDAALCRGHGAPGQSCSRNRCTAPIGKGRLDLPWRQRLVLRLAAEQHNSLAFLLAQAVNRQAGTAFTAIHSVPITQEVLPPAFESAQADANHTAGPHQASTPSIGLANQLDYLPTVQRTGQPSSSSEQKASHFFRSTRKAAASAKAFSLRCSYQSLEL